MWLAGEEYFMDCVSISLVASLFKNTPMGENVRKTSYMIVCENTLKHTII